MKATIGEVLSSYLCIKTKVTDRLRNGAFSLISKVGWVGLGSKVYAKILARRM